MPSSTPLVAFHQRLHQWYSNHGRHDLPWRNTSDPYAIYLSEIMLQQTQVKTILDRFYYPFLKKFPTLAALAKAPEQDVLKAWEGMGYYRRAKNLHAAAKMAAPLLPKDVEGLIALPGIGQNTAHAVAAFAYRHPVPVMEANVKRVIHRIFALKKAKDNELWAHAFELLDTENPYDYNQAMMDVGSMICTPLAPDCPHCPANVICQGQDNPEAYPEKIAKKKVPVRKRNIVVFEDRNGRVFLAPRETALLGGLYAFPEYEAAEKRVLFQGSAYSLLKRDFLGVVHHVYSHFKLEADVYRVVVEKLKDGIPLSAAGDLPVSGVEKKILSKLIS